MDGYWDVRARASYGFPVNFIKSNLNLRGGVSYSRIPSLVDGERIAEKARHTLPFLNYLAMSFQFTSTLIPGRMYSTSCVGLALTAKVRMSKPPCVRVADQVAKSACTAI